MPPGTVSFSAIIDKKGVNPFVDVPAEVSDSFHQSGNIPVAGTLNGVPIRATLVPIGNGRHRLYVNGDMRERANVDVGDTIEVTLRLDAEPRELPLPQPPAEAFRQNPMAKAAFEALTPSRRKEVLAYLNHLKTPEALQRNVDKVVNALIQSNDG